jgi:N-glycosylase/DNA lyase
MRIIEKDNNIILEEISDFNVEQTLECGQCFHFEKIEDGEYGVVYGTNLLHLKQQGKKIICYNTNEENFRNVWMKYFDLDRDYGEIKRQLLKADIRLEEVIKENYGIRILNQEFTETLMSFIISQNKQIPHIKKIVKDISKKYGEYIGTIGEMDFYSYPDITAMKSISVEDYKECKTGFRASYLRNAAEKIINEEDFNESVLRKLSYEEAKNRLLEIKGVGEKVANCVLLFSLGYRNAFPIDVWIKRIMEYMYFGKETDNSTIMSFAKEKFGENGGYAQQYLFYYGRKNGIGK